MAEVTYDTGAGWDNLYYGTGSSAGYDPGAYYLYGAPENDDAYNAANKTYQQTSGQVQALDQLKQMMSTDEGKRWLSENLDSAGELLQAAGLPSDMKEQLRFGLTDMDAVDRKISQVKPMAEAAAAKYEEAKAARGDDPFTAEVKRKMGLADDYRSQATDAQGRTGVQMDRTNFDQDRARELEARQGMQQTEGTLRDWVAGTGPSAAQNQFQSALDQSVNTQLGMANSARGGAAALASARNQAAAQGAQQRMQGVAQAGALRAQEMQSAMGQLQQQGYNMRAQDQTRSAQGAQWEDAQSRLNDAQMARNDLMSQYYGNQAGNYEQMRQGDFARQAQMNQARDQARQNDVWTQRNYRKGMEDDQYQRDMFLAKAIMGGASGAMQAGAQIGAAALMGPAAVAPATVAASQGGNFMGGGNAMPAPGVMYGGNKGGAVSDY